MNYTAYFFYKNKKYPFDLSLFEDKSDYFSDKSIKKKDIVYLLDGTDSFQYLTTDSINSFINFIADGNPNITKSNVLQLNYLSNKYRVESLTKLTNDYINENHKEILQEFLMKQINENDFNNLKHYLPQIPESNVNNNNNNNNNENSEEENDNLNNKNDDDDDDDDSYSKNDTQNKATIKKKPKKQIKIIKISSNSQFKKRNTKGIKKKKVKQERKNESERKNELENKNQQENDKVKGKVNNDCEIEEKTKLKQVYIPQIYERIVPNYFLDYLFDQYNILLLFPPSNMYRILYQINSTNSLKQQLKTMQKSEIDEIEQKIISFLFSYVKEYGPETTLLLNILDFEKERLEFFNEKIIEYHDYIYEKCLKSRIFKNNHILYVEMKNNIEQIKEKNEKNLEEKINALRIEQEQIRQHENEQIANHISQILNDFNLKIMQLEEKINLQEQKICEQDLLICSNCKKMKIPEEIQKSHSKIMFPLSMSTINNKCFADCKFLKEIIIPSTVTKIEENAFDGCSSLSHIEIPSSVKNIGNLAFNKCSSLKTISIDLYNTKFENETFKECTKLKHIVLYSENETIKVNNFSEIFQKIGTVEKISFSPKITRILDNAFQGCTTIKQVEIPETVKMIGSNVFQGCTSLTKILIPPSIKEIGDGVFNECSSLESIDIPSSVEKIKNLAFNKCTNFKKLSIDLYKTKFENDTFKECTKLEHIEIKSEDGIINKNDFQHLFQIINTVTKISFSSNIEQISDNALEGCSSIKQIIIPSSVISIGNKAFAKCSSLEEIIFNENSSLASLGSFVFYGCLSLKQISIPPLIKEIEDCLFYECTALTRVEIPPSVTVIGESSFYGCSLLNEIEIPASVIFISKNAFSGCKSLTNITIPLSVNRIGYYKYDNNTTIENIELQCVLDLFKKSIFCGCSSLKKINFMNTEISFDKIINFDEYVINDLVSDNGILNTRIYIGKKEKTDEDFVFEVIPVDHLNDKMADYIKLINSIPTNINGILEIVGYRFPLKRKDFDDVCQNVFNYSKAYYDEFFQNSIIVTKFIKNGTIEALMNKYFNSANKAGEKINPTIRSKLIFGVAVIMKNLHAKDKFNIDLSHDNIYFDDNFEPRIGVFSISRFLDKYNNEEMLLNPDYIAPENFVNNSEYKKPADVYAFSIFLYKMFSKDSLLPDDFNSSQININRNMERPRKPENIPDNYWNLINDCWKANPEERPTFEAIVNTLKNDEFAINEFGLTTNLDQLHEYQNRIENVH